MIGKRVLHFEIMEKIGEGGRGIVYKAEDTRLQRPVALKFLTTRDNPGPVVIQRFIREARVAAKLNHPNIVTIHEINQWEGQLFIAMEFVDGEPLDSLLCKDRRREGLPLDRVLDIAIQLCSGLKQAHRLDIVHRDIKPQNILMDTDNRVKILDFGIAKFLDDVALTQPLDTIGTIQYMSPEQLRGYEVDSRTDIWALGVLMYQLLSGTLPFQGEYAEAIIYSILHEEPPRLSQLRSDLPAPLCRIVRRALAKKVDERYGDVSELLDGLRALSLRETNLRTAERPVSALDRISIAVLPFSDMSPGGDQEYFCDGMAEELINVLSQVRDLRVASRLSSFQFKGQARDIREIGDRLNVQTILEGSVRKAQNRVRVTAQLIDVDDGFHIWSQRFDREIEDIFGIQDEIALAIMDSLKVKLLGAEKEKITRRFTDDPAAYKLYLKGRFFWNRRYEGGLKRSIEYFQQALEADPGYALPYVGIADSLNILGFYGYIPPEIAFPRARQAAEAALGIDDELGEAYASLGWINTFYDWDWPQADASYKKAIEINPYYATAHEWYAIYLALMGRFAEAHQQVTKALDLDPLSLIINSVLGLLLVFEHKYEAAVAQLNKTLDLDPNFVLAHIWRGEALMFDGKVAEALEDYSRALALGMAATYATGDLGLAQGLLGNTEAAHETLSRLRDMEGDMYLSRTLTALVFVGIGDAPSALDELEQAVVLKDPFLLLVNAAPHFDPMRDEGDFNALLKRLGIVA